MQKFIKTIKQFFKEEVALKGKYTFILENIHTREKRVIVAENLITTIGKGWIASRLAQTGTPADIKITHSALGTNTATPSASDTQLGTEVYRKAVASATSSNNVAYLSAYYTATEVVGTFKEAGMFINASGTANSGTLFSKVGIDITKSNVETLTINYEITLN